MLAVVREFLDGRGYWEVDTPILSADTAVDAHIEPVSLVGTATNGRSQRYYLQTSPEFAMKRLLAAGADAIYQIAHVFRADESGRLHNLEFTLLEWYRCHADYCECIDEVAALVGEVLDCGSCERLTYREAFLRHAGIDPHAAATEHLRNLASHHGFTDPDADRDDLLNFLLAALVEPNLGIGRPTFLIDYPASQAALAKVRPGEPSVAMRFELYVSGIELCNGYQELTDAAELRRRNELNNARRQKLGKPPLPVDSRLLAAMEAGLPECAGVALGFDRLVMVALGASSIAEVIPFPFERA
jgi:lysyl-tRNA synthetase class 2